MKLHFRRPPDFNRLCLMSSDMPGWYVFKHPFVLNRANIQAFILFHSPFAGKYVFDRGGRRLALSPGEDIFHRRIAASALGGTEKEKMFGGDIDFDKSEGKICFELYGDSGHFGKPLKEDLEMAAEHIAGLLRSIGYSPLIEPGECSIIVKGGNILI